MPSDEVFRVYGYSGLWRIVRRGVENVRLKPVDGGTSVKVPLQDITPAGRQRVEPTTVFSGFHVLKDRWSEIPRIEEYCGQLIENLEDAIEATCAKAPKRSAKQGFQTSLRYTARRPESIPERQLEWDVFTAFRPDVSLSGESDGLWKYLATYQLPLFADGSKDNWGHVDLLGINTGNVPVVIELKQHGATDSPLRSALEAAGYAIALREVLNKVFDELAETMASSRVPIGHIPTVPPHREIQIVVLAPKQYWTHVSDAMTHAAKCRFRELLQALRGFGLQATLAEINVTTDGSYVARRVQLTSEGV